MEPILRVVLDLYVRGSNADQQWGRVTTRRKHERKVTWEALEAAWDAKAETPALPLDIRLIRIASRRIDDQNLLEAFKSVIDETCDWLGCDDGDRWATRWLCTQEEVYVPPREVHLTDGRVRKFPQGAVEIAIYPRGAFDAVTGRIVVL